MMYLSPFILTCVSAFSILSITNAETGGLFSVRGDTASNVHISACSSDGITIEGNNNLEPGFIITQIDGKDTSNCDDECSFLFRKIVSNDGEGTYGTALATFADIFPEETFDKVLADTSVESVFGCKEQKEYNRKLQDTTDAPTVSSTVAPSDSAFVNTLCSIYPYLNIVVTAITVISPLLPFLVPVVPFLIPITVIISLIFAGTNTCGVTWENFLSELVGGGLFGGGDSRSAPLDNDVMQVLGTAGALIGGNRALGENNSFHPPYDGWMTSSNKGQCDYVDCTVGTNSNASCFSDDIETVDFSFDGMIDMNGVLLSKDSDLIHAFGFQDYCYASSIFEKDSCDSIIFKSLVNKCQVSMSSQTRSQLVSLPLVLSDMKHDCLSSSILFYIGAKSFGNNMHSRKQEIQLKHNKEDVCNQLLTTNDM